MKKIELDNQTRSNKNGGIYRLDNSSAFLALYSEADSSESVCPSNAGAITPKHKFVEVFYLF